MNSSLADKFCELRSSFIEDIRRSIRTSPSSQINFPDFKFDLYGTNDDYHNFFPLSISENEDSSITVVYYQAIGSAIVRDTKFKDSIECFSMDGLFYIARKIDEVLNNL